MNGNDAIGEQLGEIGGLLYDLRVSAKRALNIALEAFVDDELEAIQRALTDLETVEAYCRKAVAKDEVPALVFLGAVRMAMEASLQIGASCAYTPGQGKVLAKHFDGVKTSVSRMQKKAKDDANATALRVAILATGAHLPKIKGAEERAREGRPRVIDHLLQQSPHVFERDDAGQPIVGSWPSEVVIKRAILAIRQTDLAV